MVERIVHLLWRFHRHVFEELNDAGLARHASEAFCVRRGIVQALPSETVNDDAYIAVNVKKKGWLIKFSADSQISICGPKTFKEYFQQRRRVVFGHYQLRRLTGETPQYLVHMLPHQPLRTVKLVMWLCTKYDPFTLATFLTTEFLINAAALFDFGFGKTHFQWTTLPSTKTVLPKV
jgi:cellulose synthase/poly-beta-1,6-N-acetylglucosamine synthase-like glycosyltransferase